MFYKFGRSSSPAHQFWRILEAEEVISLVNGGRGSPFFSTYTGNSSIWSGFTSISTYLTPTWLRSRDEYGMFLNCKINMDTF